MGSEERRTRSADDAPTPAERADAIARELARRRERPDPPLVLFAKIIGLVLLFTLLAAVILWSDDAVGVAGLFAIPCVIGAAITACCRVSVALQFILVVPLVLAVVFGLAVGGLNGLGCSIVAFLLWAVPALLGAVIAILVCPSPEDPRRPPTHHILLFLVALPLVVHAVERCVPFSPSTVVVTTARRVEAPTPLAWDRLRFYESCDHEPPSWFAFGFPRPVAVEGPFEAIGDEQLCRYDKGWVRKRLDRRVPGRALGFVVLEQEHGYERSIGLRRGDYELTPVRGGTLVEARTVYEARLRPRFVWAPIERRILRGFHDHLLDGLETPAPTDLAARPGDVPR